LIWNPVIRIDPESRARGYLRVSGRQIKDKMAKEARKLVTLECTVCKSRNYHTEKRLKGMGVIARLEFEKYCPHDRKKTVHKETK
jgi:large subunit ribosomal protein L33